MTDKICKHCGAVGADLFANDGSEVCERCFAYDQVVAGELRVSQADLGLIPTGDATGLVNATGKAGRNEGFIAIALFVAAAAFFYWAVTTNPMGYWGGAVLLIMAGLMTFQSVRTARFAKKIAPDIVRRASSAPPPAMTGPASKR